MEEAATIRTAQADAPAADVSVRMDDVSKHFGAFIAVDHVDLDVRRGEFFSLLGPSGSGKTTCLRMIAGFERPTSGRILLDGSDVTARAPYERDVNTVFQDYALFPHMTVQENVEYGLRVKRVAKGERRERASDALALVRLGEFAQRKPSQLSGGQRQRVALARALVNRPGVLLLDEPLGALDLKLRQEMQIELKHIQQTVGITFIYVTHDQEEALSMSDRLAVFNQGRIEQIGSPSDVYERPASEFVANFVGTSNVLGDGCGRAAREAAPRGRGLCRPERRGGAARDDRGRRLPRPDHALRGAARGRIGARRTSAEPRADVYGSTGRPGAPGTGRLARRSRRRHHDATG